MEVTREVVVPWKMGLHMRPATKIVQTLQGFAADVELSKGDVSCNAKSLLNILTLETAFGEKLQIRATGKDAEEAVASLDDLFRQAQDTDTSEDPLLW